MSYVCLWIPRSPTAAECDATDAVTGAVTGVATDAATDAATGNATADHDAASGFVTSLLTVAPHVALETRAEGALYWVDVRGLLARRVANAVLRMAREAGHAHARIGVAGTAIAAELAAAREGEGGGPALVVVPPGTDASFLAPLPLTGLAEAASSGAIVDERGHGVSPAVVATSIASLEDVGIESCGELARLTQAAVELRFGAIGVALWRLARADTTLRGRHSLALFPPVPRALPSASVTWDDYAIRDTERLAFVVNRLATTVCDGLQRWGEGARTMAMQVALADRTVVERPVRAARTTASRQGWVRLIRAELERLTLPDAVVGLSLRVEAAGDTAALQGDLFDRGFQSGAAVAEALAGLVDDGRATIVGLSSTELTSLHPFPEQRARWRRLELATVLQEDDERVSHSAASPAGSPHHARSTAALGLQLLPAPRRVSVVTERRRSYNVPVHFTDPAPEEERGPWSGDVSILTAAGPDQLSSRMEDGTSRAREYFHCLTSGGVLVLLFRDALRDDSTPERAPASQDWYVHGWWD